MLHHNQIYNILIKEVDISYMSVIEKYEEYALM